MPGPDSKSALRTKLKIREWALYLGQISPAAAKLQLSFDYTMVRPLLPTVLSWDVVGGDDGTKY